jgi:serine-type D-Ala-D-Ala carboxypeptidase (penicillin-binding protein 5/6)
MPWPNYGQEAFGAVGYGLLATSGTQKAAPIASIAKLVTALAVLQKYPLQVGQQGPELTMGPSDINLYNQYVAEEGSVVPVNDGEQISEYQMLQAMMLPSANNIADSLANWAFGSQASYLIYANNLVKSWGLTQTHLADASGFSPQSESSAQNLITLGEKTLDNPVLASIVGQSQATLPVAGTVYNVDWLLGTDGVVGIKTGNTDQAGGCFLFAANQTVAGQQIEVIGAILGAPTTNTPNQAIDDSQPMIQATDNNFQAAQIAKAGQVFGTYKAPWGASSKVTASQNLTTLAWIANNPKVSVNLSKLSSPTTAGETVGAVNVDLGQTTKSVPILLQQKIPAPSLFWRIFHI